MTKQTEELLKKAHSYFTDLRYDKALFLYSQLCSQEPKNIEYQLYCIFCDIGYESDQKAQSLFDYFIIEKDKNFDGAVDVIMDIIAAYDGDNEKMMLLLKEISTINSESLDAIDYKDFLKLIEDRGSFKQAYEDIMFSTKVAITSKDELLDFVNNLIENNFKSTAYNYLDGVNEFFAYDQEVSKLYEKLKEDKH